jgi:hypothetical protein
MQTKSALILLAVLFSPVLIRCTVNTAIATNVEDSQSALLPLLIAPSDFSEEFHWDTQSLEEKTASNLGDSVQDFASMLFDGQVSRQKTNVFVRHSLYCYLEPIVLSQVSIVDAPNSTELPSFGDEMLASCMAADTALSGVSVVSSCVIEVRYSRLISIMMLSYQSPDLAFLENLGNDLLSIVDSRIIKSSVCE